MGNKVKAILKWAGGKSSLSSMISQYFLTKKNMDRYIEPFFGGGSLFFYIANNNKDFLKSSKEGSLVCEASPIKLGKRSQIWEAKIYNGDTLCAISKVRLSNLDA